MVNNMRLRVVVGSFLLFAAAVTTIVISFREDPAANATIELLTESSAAEEQATAKNLSECAAYEGSFLRSGFSSDECENLLYYMKALDRTLAGLNETLELYSSNERLIFSIIRLHEKVKSADCQNMEDVLSGFYNVVLADFTQLRRAEAKLMTDPAAIQKAVEQPISNPAVHLLQKKRQRSEDLLRIDACTRVEDVARFFYYLPPKHVCSAVEPRFYEWMKPYGTDSDPFAMLCHGQQRF